MNNSLMKQFPFDAEQPPILACPSCEHGRLRFIKESLVKSEDARTRNWKENWDEYDSRDATLHFSVRWKCDEPKCAEVLHMIGEACYGIHGVVDSDGQDYPEEYLAYHPHFMAPSLPLFSIPEGTPKTVRASLKAGFNLAFCDTNAAANHLRKAVECLLNELGVPNNTALGNRIKNLTSPHDLLKHDLEAVKWLGNEGSHGTGINQEHMLLGYAIMEKCLLHLYDGLHQKVKAINQHKGPVPTARHFRHPSDGSAPIS